MEGAFFFYVVIVVVGFLRQVRGISEENGFYVPNGLRPWKSSSSHEDTPATVRSLCITLDI